MSVGVLLFAKLPLELGHSRPEVANLALELVPRLEAQEWRGCGRPSGAASLRERHFGLLDEARLRFTRLLHDLGLLLFARERRPWNETADGAFANRRAPSRCAPEIMPFSV